MNNSLPTTRLAILSTIGSLHNEPLRYDLQRLQTLIVQLAPDLLCADITREAWESGILSQASLEVREALAPLIALTDTVLIPVAPSSRQFVDFNAPPGLRDWLARRFEDLLSWGQRKASSPEAINGIVFQAFCHTICTLEEMTWNQDERNDFKRRTLALADNILAAVERDPGGRILVVVQCQWHHTLEPLLRSNASNWLEIVDYRKL